MYGLNCMAFVYTNPAQTALARHLAASHFTNTGTARAGALHSWEPVNPFALGAVNAAGTT
jgi:hypothetical protein